MNSTEKGTRGERIAALYMQANGMKILEANYRKMHCEIDLIAMDGDMLVFTEVKARSVDTMGMGREAVTRKKQQNIIKAAQCYIIEHGLSDTAARFDVAEVELNTGMVEYMANAFEV